MAEVPEEMPDVIPVGKGFGQETGYGQAAGYGRGYGRGLNPNCPYKN